MIEGERQNHQNLEMKYKERELKSASKVIRNSWNLSAKMWNFESLSDNQEILFSSKTNSLEKTKWGKTIRGEMLKIK